MEGCSLDCLGANNIGPRLILHPDRVEFRLFRLRSKPYSSISRVDYRKTRGTENIVLEFRDSVTSFIGNTGNRATARAAIRHLHGKDCHLSEHAIALLRSA